MALIDVLEAKNSSKTYRIEIGRVLGHCGSQQFRCFNFGFRPTGAFSKSSRYQLVWFQGVVKLIIAILFGELDEGVCHPQCSCRSGIVWEWYRTAKIREVIRRIDLELGQRGAALTLQHGKFGQDWSFTIDLSDVC